MYRLCTPLIYLILKAINLQVNDWLYEKTKVYADERSLPLVGAIRLILSEFHRNRANMNKKEELPEGIIDMGEGKGYAIDMEKLRDKDGVAHPPPDNLTKEQTLQWIREHYNGKKN
jgi:hypothetical protein